MSSKIQLTKKRRIVSKSGESSKSSPKRLKNTSSDRNVESKQKIPYNEENEIEVRTIHQDLELHRETCSNVQSLFQEIKDLKGGSKNELVVAKKRAAVSVLFVTLKKMNRLSHLRCKKARDTTQAKKQQVDGLHLQLQNLLYEVMHLQKEITKCLEFESNDEKIDLVDVATFYKEAPLDISLPSITEDDPHKQRLARLDWELEQRKRLSEKYKTSQSNRDLVAQEIKSKQEYLDSLQPSLNNILKATLPVQQHLALPFEEIRTQHQMARLLPRPLYILFVQASAYSEACDGSLKVKIEGDSDTASATVSSSIVIEEDSDSENEETQTESKRRRKTVGDKLEEKRKTILAKHPLQVVLHLTLKEEAILLILTFSYLMELQIVTVTVELKDASGLKNMEGELLSAKDILGSLYPEDDGTESPYSANTFQLQRVGMDSLSGYIKTTGTPYIWCQWLSGLDFLQCEENKAVKAITNLSSSHMEVTIKALKARVASRITLQKQILLFGRSSIPVPGPAAKMFPLKIWSKLVSWKPITEEVLSHMDYIVSHPARDRVGSGSFYYLATCERKTVKVEAVVVVRKAYPITSPLFFIKMIWKGQIHTATNDHNIMDLEAEVNLYSQELISPKTSNYLLSCQVQRWLMCVDLYLEAATAEKGSHSPGETVQFPKEKMFVRNARGRSRSKPYKYNAQYGYFSQR